MSIIANYDIELDKLLEKGLSLDEIDRIRKDPAGTAKAEMLYDWKIDYEEHLEAERKKRLRELEAR